MEQIIEFIMSNLFLIIIIISAVLGFFNNPQKNDNKKKQPARPKQERRFDVPSSQPRTEPADQQPLGKVPDVELDKASPVSIDSVEEQQQQQMEKLARSLNTNTDEVVDKVSSLSGDLTGMLNETTMKDLTKDRQELRRRVRKGLKGKQLMNGIIMAEILGPPRAIKPYKSVVEERRIK